MSKYINEQNQYCKVTVIVPVYNSQDFIEETLESVLNQTFEDFVILIIDNSSNNLTYLKTIKYTDKRIMYIKNANNIRLHGSINKWLKLTESTYLVILNSDDVWDETFLMRSVYLLENNKNISYVHSKTILMEEKGEAFGFSVTNWKSVTSGRESFLKNFCDGYTFSAILMRTATARHIAPIPDREPWRTFPDDWLVLNLCLYGDVGYIAEPLMRYRVHGGGLMSQAYLDGSFFIRRIETVRESFAWPEVQRWRIQGCRRQTERHIALHSAAVALAMRETHSYKNVLEIFIKIISVVPSAPLQPILVARLLLCLLPRNCVAALRTWRRNRRKNQLCNS